MFTTKLRLAALPVLTVGILFAGGVFILHDSPGRAAPAPAAPKVPKELLEKRRDTAKQVYREKFLRYQSGFGSSSQLLGWSERWLESELALTETKADRISALLSHLDRTRHVERIAIAFVKAGGARQSEADEATYERLNAEVRIVQSTGKIPPPPVYDKPVAIPEDLQSVKEKDEDEREKLKGKQRRLRRQVKQPGDTKEAAPAKDRKELLQQRVKAAEHCFNNRYRELMRGIENMADLFGFSEHWLEAELALSDKEEGHLAALKAHLERTREVERVAINYARVGIGMCLESDAHSATYERINAEIRYFQTTGEAPSPPPASKTPRAGDQDLLAPPVERPNKTAKGKKDP